MTKKYLMTLTAALFCAMTMVVLTACTDIHDNPAPVVVVDDKEWKADANKDTSVRPGDDFFMYCNGGWWNSTVVDETTPFKKLHIGNLEDEMKKREVALTLPSKTKVLADAGKTDAATIKAQKDQLQSAIDRVNAVTTKEEVWKLLGELYKEGYRTPFDLLTFSIDGKVVITLNVYAVKDYTAQLWSKQSLWWRLANDADLLARVRPLKGAATRGFNNDKWPMLVTFFNTLGISLDDVYTIDTFPDFILRGSAGMLLDAMIGAQDMSLEEWKDELKEVLKEDAVYFDDSAAESAAMTCKETVNNFLSIYLRYELSRAFAQAYVTADQKQLMAGYAEELRQTFRERIQQYDWMSDASKQNATEKINNMTFNIGAPDEWFDEGIADLSQEQTLFDDIRALRRAKVNLTCKLVGMTTERASFHQVISDLMPLTTVNACYVGSGNYMNILPAYMLSPNYDPNVNDAHNYANMMAWGHEIIHGFDTNGAKFNQVGNWGSLWANENDSQEFQKRAQQLIDYYSSLDIMPFETGLKNDGAFTVAENVADLGGFYLAYDSYVKHLKKQGFTGDQLRLQKQRFYEAYGYLWSAKWNAEHAKNKTLGNEAKGVKKDEHSLFRERTNGIVTNTDDWYDLFDVKPTDKLYLAPEKRIRIW
jgi:predicted metalloendopeptidase